MSDTSPAEGTLRRHVRRELARQSERLRVKRRPGWVWIWVGAGLLWAALVLWLAG